VEDGERRGEAVVVKVEVEVGQVVGRGQALVEERPERAGGHVGSGRGPLDAAAQPQRPALTLRIGACTGEHRVHDARRGRLGHVAQGRRVDGRLAPLDQRQALLGQRPVHRGPRIVAPHEQHGHPVVRPEDLGRDRRQQPRAVGGAGIGGHRAAVLHARQATEGGGDDGSGRATLSIGDETDATGVELAGRRGQHGALLLTGAVAGRRPADPGKRQYTVWGETVALPIPGRAGLQGGLHPRRH
jgi:hypothetical protein